MPRARERRTLRSESTVFYRLLFGRVPPFAGHSALCGQILESVVDIGGEGVGDPNLHGKTRHLRDPAPRILDSDGRSKS